MGLRRQPAHRHRGARRRPIRAAEAGRAGDRAAARPPRRPAGPRLDRVAVRGAGAGTRPGLDERRDHTAAGRRRDRRRRVRAPVPAAPPSAVRAGPAGRLPRFGAANAGSLLFGVAFSIMLLSNVLWCQEVWHWQRRSSPGSALAPGPALVPVVTVLTTRAAQRFGAGTADRGGRRAVCRRHCLVRDLRVGHTGLRE